MPPAATGGLIAAVAGLAALTGCGGGDKPGAPSGPEARVRQIVQRFGAASAKKDYQAICDGLIAKSLSDNVEELGLPCELAFKQGLGAVKGARLQIRSVRVRGSTAFAAVHTTAVGQPPSDDTLELVLNGGDWRISSLSAPASSTRPPAGAAPGAVRLW